MFFARTTSRLLLLAILALAAAGCEPRPSWNYNTPPTAMYMHEPSHLDPLRSKIVVVGEFHNPARGGVAWDDIGSGVSEALSQALLNQGDFDVWSNQQLAVQVEQVLAGPTEDRSAGLAKLHVENPDIRFVITGQVTDFHHTNEVPREVRRQFLIFGTRREALVAIHFQFVDLNAARVLIADHVYGTAKAGRRSTEAIYGELAFGSYLFWNSPLGRATEVAIAEAMKRINQVVPDAPARSGVRIVKRVGPREVQLTEPVTRRLRPGSEFYVCRDDGGVVIAVTDQHTGQPLRVLVLPEQGAVPVGWLLGVPAAGVELVGAELRAQLPGQATVASAKPVEGAPRP